MDIYWPENLPSGFLAEGFVEQPRDNVIRTPMDAGPNKTRRRYTAGTVNFTGRQVFDAEEMAVFRDFYRAALADGALRFYFPDPVTRETAEFRFTAVYSAVANEGYFDVTLPLERL